MKNDPYTHQFISSLLSRTNAADPDLFKDWVTLISWIEIHEHSELVVYLNEQIIHHLLSDSGGANSEHTIIDPLGHSRVTD